MQPNPHFVIGIYQTHDHTKDILREHLDGAGNPHEENCQNNGPEMEASAYLHELAKSSRFHVPPRLSPELFIGSFESTAELKRSMELWKLDCKTP
jgi:hypothetical protein